MFHQGNWLLVQSILFFEGDFNVSEFFTKEPAAKISEKQLPKVEVDVSVVFICLAIGNIVPQQAVAYYGNVLHLLQINHLQLGQSFTLTEAGFVNLLAILEIAVSQQFAEY